MKKYIVIATLSTLIIATCITLNMITDSIAQRSADKDWTSQVTHNTEALQTLEALDSGIHDIDKQLQKLTIGSGNHFKELHRVRALYLENRVLLLYHLYSLTPPQDWDDPEE